MARICVRCGSREQRVKNFRLNCELAQDECDSVKAVARGSSQRYRYTDHHESTRPMCETLAVVEIDAAQMQHLMCGWHEVLAECEDKLWVGAIERALDTK